jgi:hypothetical protein
MVRTISFYVFFFSCLLFLLFHVFSFLMLNIVHIVVKFIYLVLKNVKLLKKSDLRMLRYLNIFKKILFMIFLKMFMTLKICSCILKIVHEFRNLDHGFKIFVHDFQKSTSPLLVPRSCVVRCSLHTFCSVLLGQKPTSPYTLIGKCPKLIHCKLLF